MGSDTQVRKPATSFIIRMWRDGSTPGRGEIENIATGEKRLFLNYDGLTDLLESWQADLETVG